MSVRMESLGRYRQLKVQVKSVSTCFLALGRDGSSCGQGERGKQGWIHSSQGKARHQNGTRGNSLWPSLLPVMGLAMNL